MAISNRNLLLGSVVGDVIASSHLFNESKTKNFKLFNKNSRPTYATILNIAVADGIINNKPIAKNIRLWAKKHGRNNFGTSFNQWLNQEDYKPYGGSGISAVTRIPSCGILAKNIADVFNFPIEPVFVTHNTKSALYSAQFATYAVYLAKLQKDKDEAKTVLKDTFVEIALDQSLNEMRSNFTYARRAEEILPAIFTSFYESENYEDSIRNAISLGGDCCTITSLTGTLAQGYYRKIPEDIVTFVLSKLPDDMKSVIEQYEIF